MARNNRSDPHRPGAIVPADYEYVFSYNLATSEGGWPIPSLGINCELDRRYIRKNDDGTETVVNGSHDADGLCCVVGMRGRGHKFFDGSGAGKCSVCGTCYIYGDVWRHVPTGEHIHLGHTCAAKYSMLADRSEWELANGRAPRSSGKGLKSRGTASESSRFVASLREWLGLSPVRFAKPIKPGRGGRGGPVSGRSVLAPGHGARTSGPLSALAKTPRWRGL